MLRTNLQFSSPDNPVHSLVVTSATPSEGKTTTSANVAVTFAQAGNKVLLVDGDLRKPSVNKIFGMANIAGLSNLIVSNISPREVIQPCWVDNLYVLTSGPIPPNPAELLGSKRSRQLFSLFEENFDMVIIDAPPVAAVGDALILSTMASGTLLVIAYREVEKDLAKRTVDQLRNVKANLLGVVLNKVPEKGAGYFYYEYGSTN
jgi:capsular exopolysaccharide synthesis family protein